MFAEQVFSSDSDTSESEKLLAAAKYYLKMRSVEGKTKRESLQKEPYRELPIQVLLDHITFFIS